MTRKDYELIAKAISDSRPRADFMGRGVADHALNTVTELLADELAKRNPHFNREKFVEAAGGGW